MSYCNAPGGRLGCACLRIAIACSLLWTLARIHAHAASAESAIYYPHGIWLVVPGRPSPELLRWITAIAWASTIALLVGAASRAMHVVSLLAVLAIATYNVSSTLTWSHQNVPPLLASIAFLGARGGDILSIDAWWRRFRGLPAYDVAGGYQWSIRLVQIAVVSIFFVAGCCKLASGGPRLGWALSDNLRNQILIRFDAIGVSRTAAANWLVARVWRCKAIALANLASQLSPIASVWQVDRPRVRAALGLVWIAEIVGLGVVMDYWDLHWLPLAAVFVDWDRLARIVAPPVRGRAPRGRRVFVGGFLAFYALHAFVLDQRLNLYPFSSFPMFAAVRAKRPFGRHQSYEVIGGHVVLASRRPLTSEEQHWIDRRNVYRRMWRERRPAALRRDLQAILDDTRHQFPDAGITRARIVLSVDQASAYPAAARLDRRDLAIVGELDVAGQFRTAFGAIGGTIVTAGEVCSSTLVAFRDDDPDPLVVAASRTSTGFVLDAAPAGNPLYLACEAGGERWLVAQHASRGY